MMAARVDVEIEGAERALRRLENGEKLVRRARNRAISRYATKVKREHVQEFSRVTGVKAKILRNELFIDVKRPGLRRPVALVGHSGQGIFAFEFKTRVVPTSNPSRARVYVRWFDGWRLVAGFVNPLGKGVPRSTRREGGDRPHLAIGPSPALMFSMSRMSDPQTLAKRNEELAPLIEAEMQVELRKAGLT